jgi:hypothetical protein
VKLKMFEAEAEVLGKMRSVQFREDGLMMTGLTYDEAILVLRLVGPKTEAPSGLQDQFRAPVTAEKSSAKEATRSSEDRVLKAVKDPEPQKSSVTEKLRQLPPLEHGALAGGKGEPPFDVDPPELKTMAQLATEQGARKQPEFPATSKEDLKVAKGLEGVKEPGSDGVEVPKKIAESTRFVDVLEWVISTKKLKKTQVAEIIAAFGSLGLGDVPAVRRVRDLGDKVTSTLAAYEEAGDAA